MMPALRQMKCRSRGSLVPPFWKPYQISISAKTTGIDILTVNKEPFRNERVLFQNGVVALFGNAILFQLSVECGEANVEQSCCFGFIAFRHSQDFQNMLLFY